MRKQARVLVIGGGAIGVSVAYHLAKYGWKDVVLVEKHELTSGSTWMAAGNCSFYHSNYYCTQVNMKSIELYQKLEAETGQSAGWHTTGSIRTADNPDRMDELGYYYSMNRCLGLNVQRVTPAEIAQLHPLMNVEGLLGGLYWPDDGDVDPSSITLAMSIGAKKFGAEINTHTRVTGIDRKPNGEWVVRTDKGDVTCEYRGQCRRPVGPRGGAHGRARDPLHRHRAHAHPLRGHRCRQEPQDASAAGARPGSLHLHPPGDGQPDPGHVRKEGQAVVSPGRPLGLRPDRAAAGHRQHRREHRARHFPDAHPGRDRLQARDRRPHHLHPERRPAGRSGLPAEEVLPRLRLQLRHHPGRRHRALHRRLDHGGRAGDRPVVGGQPPLRELRHLGLQPREDRRHLPAALQHLLPQRVPLRRAAQPHQPHLRVSETGRRRVRRLFRLGVPQLLHRGRGRALREAFLAAVQRLPLRGRRVPPRDEPRGAAGPDAFCQNADQRPGRRGLAQPHELPAGADPSRAASRWRPC